MHSLVKELKFLIRQILIPEIPSMVSEVKQKNPSQRKDSVTGRLEYLIFYINKRIKNKVNTTILESERISVDIAEYNKIQFEKMNKSVFGIDIFVSEPWLSDQLKLFASQNAQLIKSLPHDELQRITAEIERGLQQGERFENISQTIQKSFGIIDRRATLIARDQTTKLNSSLTRLRQQEVGVTKFYWQTSGDERVRNSHALMDGLLCSWSDPNIYYENGESVARPAGATKTFVGSDVNCRCIARPYLEDLLSLGK